MIVPHCQLLRCEGVEERSWHRSGDILGDFGGQRAYFCGPWPIRASSTSNVTVLKVFVYYVYTLLN